MMKSIKVSELTEATLDWAVAKCDNVKMSQRIDSFKVYGAVVLAHGGVYSPSTNWAQGGPIIKREGIATRENGDSDDWYACKRWDNHGKFGATPLIAAMRCYVASKLGDTIDVPEGLL
jgi:hypothetical protein